MRCSFEPSRETSSAHISVARRRRGRHRRVIHRRRVIRRRCAMHRSCFGWSFRGCWRRGCCCRCYPIRRTRCCCRDCWKTRPGWTIHCDRRCCDWPLRIDPPCRSVNPFHGADPPCCRFWIDRMLRRPRCDRRHWRRRGNYPRRRGRYPAGLNRRVRDIARVPRSPASVTVRRTGWQSSGRDTRRRRGAMDCAGKSFGCRLAGSDRRLAGWNFAG